MRQDPFFLLIWVQSSGYQNLPSITTDDSDVAAPRRVLISRRVDTRTRPRPYLRAYRVRRSLERHDLRHAPHTRGLLPREHMRATLALALPLAGLRGVAPAVDARIPQRWCWWTCYRASEQPPPSGQHEH